MSVIDAYDIIDKVNVNRRNIDTIDYHIDLLEIEENVIDINNKKIGKGLQRELVQKKVDEICKYLEQNNGLIPNSIILNISDPLEIVVFDNDKNIIEIPDDESIILTALDGQHRLEGLKKFLHNNPNIRYDLPVTIFYNTNLEFQTYLFSTINSTQTKINKSFLYDLLALTSKQVDAFKLCHEIAYWLNASDNSVLKGEFKLLGKGNGWLSQAAFIDYLLPNVFLREGKDNSNVIFKRLRKGKEYNKIANFINDYFKAIKYIYPIEFSSSDYIFRTSFVFGLFMKFMPYVFIYSLDGADYKYDKIVEMISWIKQSNFDFKKGGINSGVGSYGRQNQLLGEFLGIVKQKIDVDDMVASFRRQNSD